MEGVATLIFVAVVLIVALPLALKFICFLAPDSGEVASREVQLKAHGGGSGKFVPLIAILSMMAFGGWWLLGGNDHSSTARKILPQSSLGAPKWAFGNAEGSKQTPAVIVGSYSRSDIPGGLWPFRQTFVTVICSPGSLIAVLGPADVLALNGWTSSWRDHGRVYSESGDRMRIFGLSSTDEARAASIVDSRATTQQVNAATDALLRRALDRSECR